MAKANKKSPKKSSNIFHNIMAASVKGNPKPKKAAKKKDAKEASNIFHNIIAASVTATKKK